MFPVPATPQNAMSPREHAALAHALRQRGLPHQQASRVVVKRATRGHRTYTYWPDRNPAALVTPVGAPHGRWRTERYDGRDAPVRSHPDAVSALVQAVADTSLPVPPPVPPGALAPIQRAELAALLRQRGIPRHEMDSVYNKTGFPGRPLIAISWDDRRRGSVFIRPTSDPHIGEYGILHSGDSPDITVSFCEGNLMATVAQAIAENRAANGIATDGE